MNFDRFVAKQVLESVNHGPSNGMFLVRCSSKNLHNYALTLYYEKEFFNFEIICLDTTTFYIDDGPFFDSLEHLVDHYCRIPDGLPTTLTYSVNKLLEVVPMRVKSSTIHCHNNNVKGKSKTLNN